jgi:hypothetical protein
MVIANIAVSTSVKASAENEGETTMKNFRKSSKFLTKAGLVGLGVCFAAGLAGTADAQVLPPNPDPTCVVSPSEFNGWFVSGPPFLNVLVKPADSILLDTSDNCNFYKWSEQMFLWLTSPASGIYQGGHVFDTQVFYQVINGTLVAQNTFVPRNFALRAAQVGPDGLPVVIDAAGNLREFVTAPSNAGITTLALPRNRQAPIAKVETGNNGKAVFRDANNRIVQVTPRVTADMLPQTLGRLTGLLQPSSGLRALSETAQRQQIADALTATRALIAFNTGSGPVFVEAGTGIIIHLGPGQAGGNGVLTSQQNSVIFYETLVNDVYAWYLTGRKTQGGIAPYYVGSNPATYGLFPISAADLKSIEDFSKAHGGPPTFPDGDALAIEVKLSWVEASTLPNNAQGYITTQAIVPTYDTSNPRDWVPAAPKLATVALVGVHIVGSAKNHPEMIWATFEHQANTPLATYQYTVGGNPVTVQQNTTGNWLFAKSGASANFNTELAVLCPNGIASQCPSPSLNGHIVAVTSAAILPPTNVLRQKAWGVASNGVPNNEDKTPAASNTEIISIDTNVQAQLSAGGASADPRYNYLFIGSTWTFGGGPPTGPYPFNPANPTNPPQFNEVGTSMLFNSTLETFQQGTNSTYQVAAKNCFNCHGFSKNNDPKTKATTSVSHIFGSINPLQ